MFLFVSHICRIQLFDFFPFNLVILLDVPANEMFTYKDHLPEIARQFSIRIKQPHLVMLIIVQNQIITSGQL